MSSAVALRGEVQSFEHVIVNTIDAIVGALDGLTAEELNWRPDAPATNSLYAIATHVLGNAEENLLGTLCGESHGRSYTTLTREDLDAARAHPRRAPSPGATC